jgi:TrpR family trp operon transcriptional repressor
MAVKNNLLKNLIEQLILLKDSTEMREFLLGLLTPAELEELPRRLEIVKRLKRGEAQKQIAADLGLGVATVTRGAREIKLGRFKSVQP